MVDATFSHISPMSGSELRELADQLPLPVGTKALAPPILATLPKESLDGQIDPLRGWTGFVRGLGGRAATGAGGL